MPINNSVVKSKSYKEPDKLIYPLSEAECTTDFSGQLSQDVSSINWLSLYPIVTQLVKHFFLLPQPLLILNARHWQAVTEVISEVIEDDYPLLALQNYDQQILFGRLDLCKGESIEFHQGEIYNLNNGCLILDISPMLVTPELWFLLKAFLLSHKLPATSAVNSDKLQGKCPTQPINVLNTKIIIVSNRHQLDELSQVDPEYNQVGSLFTELSSQIKTTDKNINALHAYCSQLIKQRELVPLSSKALTLLFFYLSSKCEHQKKILFSPELIENTLRYAALFITDEKEILPEHLQKSFDIQVQAQSLAQKFSEQALMEKQLLVQLNGQKIGQINGLSVIELLGYPTEFGEVFRISASDMLGDGEIIDIERKVDLAGNIHAKSTLIVQGYLHHVFTSVSNFPLSCNVVFEQSYQESDGDSAALAMLLAVTSCYAQQSLSQNLFVTGSLDQHGNVLAIGGINQKINAVARLFKLGLLSDPVTILIPQANQINLILPKETLSLIKNKKIKIYGINHCWEAFPLAMGMKFEKVIELINQRIEDLQREEFDHHKTGFIQRFMPQFK